MSYRLIKSDTLQSVADAIREKKRMTEDIPVSSFSDEIASIELVGVFPSGTLDITENGTYDVTTYLSTKVDVETPTEELDVTENGEYIPSEGKHFSKVTVDVETPTEELDVTENTENGEYTPSEGKHFSKVTVNVDLTAEFTEQDELLASIEAQLQNVNVPNGYIPFGIPITSEAEFLAMEEGGDYYLANDINVSKCYGTFRGRLHGNGRTVTVSAPLFEALEGASVCDLTIKGTVDLPDTAYVGALAKTATTANVYRVVNEADVTASSCAGGLIGYATDTCVLWGCANKGTVYSHGGYAAGILAYGKKDASFTHCINAGEIITSATDSSKAGYYCAAGIVSWVGGTGLLYYCVNAGYISGNTHVSGVGGRFGETEDVNGHVAFGCLNIGHLYTSNGDVAGLIRRVYGRCEINYNTVSGSLKTDCGNVSALLGYSTSTASNYNKNVVNVKPEDISGDELYLATAGAASAQSASASNLSDIFVLKSDSGATFKNLFKRADDTVAPVPSNYKYYFTEEQREDGTLVSKLGTEFVMEDDIPMHRGVVGTYRVAGEMNRKTLATN